MSVQGFIPLKRAPVATIFAWSGALKKRGELDENKELIRFGELLEKACIQTIETLKRATIFFVSHLASSRAAVLLQFK